MTRICLIPKVHGVGGMVSFQKRISMGLRARGIQVCSDLDDTPFDAILIIGGTRDLPGLRRARRRGNRLVQRLDGINWLHRRRRTGIRHYLRAEYGNRILALIRAHIASYIVYQSAFARGWWEDWYGGIQIPNTVIYNGVDLHDFNPEGVHTRPTDRFRLLVVEGTMDGGYEMGLETTVQLAELIAQAHPLELMLVGRVSLKQQKSWQSRSRIQILWGSFVPNERIPEIDRSAHLLYSADINPACPNSVIEAMACGLPVIAFKTGALPELVIGESGRLVPYGADPWKLKPPNIQALSQAALEILSDQPRFRLAARLRAEQAFGLEHMVANYLDILLG